MMLRNWEADKAVVQDYFRFGDVLLEVSAPVRLRENLRLSLFRTAFQTAGKHIRLACRFGHIDPPKERPDRICGLMQYYYPDSHSGREAGTVLAGLFHKAKGRHLLWTIRYNDAPDKMEVVFEPEGAEDYLSYHELLKHIGLLEMLSKRQHFVFHSCYVGTDRLPAGSVAAGDDSPRAAVLFTGNSGIGKSTQGALWEKLGLGAVINGDRSLLFAREQMDGAGQTGPRFFAGGFVYCGSSNICKNSTLPIRAIVSLKQGPDNVIRRMPAGEAMKQIFLQLSGDMYELTDTDRRLAFAADLAATVPVYEYTCTKEDAAAFFLYDYLGANYGKT